MRENNKGSGGYSLVEVTVAVFLISVSLMALLGLQRFVGDTTRFSFEEMQAVEEARSGVDTLVREIRETLQSENGSYPLARADDQEIIFYADIDDDAEVERARYFLENAELRKGVIQPTDGIPAGYPESDEEVFTVAQFITNGTEPIFYYYDGNWPLSAEGNPLDTPSRLVDTKYMRVFLKVNVNPARVPRDFELSSGVQLRNLKENL